MSRMVAASDRVFPVHQRQVLLFQCVHTQFANTGASRGLSADRSREILALVRKCVSSHQWRQRKSRPASILVKIAPDGETWTFTVAVGWGPLRSGSACIRDYG